MRIIRFMSAVFALGLVCYGCSPGGGETGSSISIRSLGWVNENISTTFLSNPTNPANSAYYDFFINYNGDFDIDDLDYARVYLPEWGESMYWTIADSEHTYFVDTARKCIGGWGRWIYSEMSNALPIGKMTAEIKLKSGEIASLARTIPAPGSLGTDGYSWMCTQKPYGDASPFVLMMPRATMISSSIDSLNSSITVAFSFNDDRVKNGEICFYAADGSYVGSSPLFVDAATGLARAFIGGAFPTDDSTITAEVDDAAIVYRDGRSFSSIDVARVFLYDGKQYPTATVNDYDSMSISDAL